MAGSNPEEGIKDNSNRNYDVLCKQLWLDFDYIYQCSCPECNQEYSRDFPPFQLWCGHSICSRCRETNTKYLCTKCGVIVLNTKDSILNKDLLDQNEKVRSDKELEKVIIDQQNKARRDPRVILERFFYERFSMTLYCYIYSKEMGSKLKLLQSDENVEDGATLIQEKNQQETDRKEKEMRTNTVEGIFEMVREEKRKFIDSLKAYEIQCDYKKINTYLNEMELKVSAFCYDADDEQLPSVAKVTSNDFGLHIHAFRRQNYLPPTLYIMFSEFKNDKPIPKYFFFDLETKIEGKNCTRRVYFKFFEDAYSEDLMNLISGLKENFKKLTFRKDEKHLICSVPAASFEEEIKKLPAKPSDIGLFRLAFIKKPVGTKLLITTEKDKSQVKNVIGICHSGRNFLREVNHHSFTVIDHGICMEGIYDEYY